MFFNSSNTIILMSILLLIIYLTLPLPIILIEKKANKKTNPCLNCLTNH